MTNKLSDELERTIRKMVDRLKSMDEQSILKAQLYVKYLETRKTLIRDYVPLSLSWHPQCPICNVHNLHFIVGPRQAPNGNVFRDVLAIKCAPIIPLFESDCQIPEGSPLFQSLAKIYAEKDFIHSLKHGYMKDIFEKYAIQEFFIDENIKFANKEHRDRLRDLYTELQAILKELKMTGKLI